MFDQILTIENENRRPWTVFAGLSGQLFALGLAMLIPLVYTDQLPLFRISDLHLLPPVSRPLPPPADPGPVTQRTQVPRSVFIAPDQLVAPIRIPTELPKIVDPPGMNIAASAPFIPGGMPGTGASGIISRLAMTPPPMPAPTVRAVETPKPVASAAAPVKVGGKVQEARLMRRVIPAYPALARQARVSGTVQLLGVIAKDGTVQKLQVLSGHPLLIDAAVSAVRQWVYRPTLLNGEPVEVICPIDVHFTLVQ
jgi:protein TonB